MKRKDFLKTIAGAGAALFVPTVPSIAKPIPFEAENEVEQEVVDAFRTLATLDRPVDRMKFLKTKSNFILAKMGDISPVLCNEVATYADLADKIYGGNWEGFDERRFNNATKGHKPNLKTRIWKRMTVA